MTELTARNHDRDSAGLQYIYPVVSRRAGGVSVGINLNPNNACNWRCLYCQVPQLTRGTAPSINVSQLESELRAFLHELLHGDFMLTRVPPEARRLNDLALSGNGEPTSAAEFSEVMACLARVRHDMAIPPEVKTVLITNGSLLHRPTVQDGLRQMVNGELWFKLDRASAAGIAQINDSQQSMDKVRTHLVTAIDLCPTWLQTCWFALDGAPPSAQDENNYLDFVAALLRDGHRPQGVLLYGLARPSLQPEAPRLTALPAAALQAFAARIQTLGLPVKVSI